MFKKFINMYKEIHEEDKKIYISKNRLRTFSEIWKDSCDRADNFMETEIERYRNKNRNKKWYYYLK